MSESPEVRQGLKKRIEQVLAENNLAGSEVEVLSAYKQGFFWLTERVPPSLKDKGVHHVTVRFTADEDPRNALKRSYSEPYRWLQELYPADEILARELQIPLERIEFEIKPAGGPVYEALAFDEKGSVLFQQCFSPADKGDPLPQRPAGVGPVQDHDRLAEGRGRKGDRPRCRLSRPTWNGSGNSTRRRSCKPVYSHVLAKDRLRTDVRQAALFQKAPCRAVGQRARLPDRVGRGDGEQPGGHA